MHNLSEDFDAKALAAVRPRASELLIRVGSLLHVEREAIGELRGAGMREEQIAALYPFDWVELKATAKVAGQLSTGKIPPVFILGDVLSCINHGELDARMVRLLVMIEDSAVTGIDDDAAARAELCIRLLNLLTRAQALSPLAHLFPGRAENFLDATGDFISALAKQAKVIEPSALRS